MKQFTLSAATALAVALNPAISDARNDGRGPAPQLEAPEAVMCTIDADLMAVNVEWSPVEGATKYSLDFSCEDPMDTMEVEFDFEPEEALVDAFAMVGFDVFPEPIVLVGEGAWTCTAKVKGLNPPGRSQNNPKTSAICMLPEPPM